MTELLQLKDVKTYIKELKPQFNNFKTVQDRKYIIYQIFKYCINFNINHKFKLDKLYGSNQVILYYQYNPNLIITLYNSDNDKYNIKDFEIKLESWINQYIMNRDKQ